MAKLASGQSKSAQLIAAAKQLKNKANLLDFSVFTKWVYNPLDYAWDGHCQYIMGHFQASCKVVFVGMNPGPWGMAQTGVPFGEVSMVRDWLGIDATIGQPKVMHPQRPIEGLKCNRSEVSGQRFWGFFKQRFSETKQFFAEHFVVSYCPLAFMSDSGANITPDKLPADLRTELTTVCDDHLARVIEVVQPEWMVGVGNWAEQRCREVLDQFDNAPQLGKILHPSPASPAANRDWPKTVLNQLTELGIWQ